MSDLRRLLQEHLGLVHSLDEPGSGYMSSGIEVIHELIMSTMLRSMRTELTHRQVRLTQGILLEVLLRKAGGGGIVCK
jgi:hypothetical protein